MRKDYDEGKCPEIYVCGICGKKFFDRESKEDFISHCQSHSLEKPTIEEVQNEEKKTATEMMVNDMQEEEYYNLKHTQPEWKERLKQLVGGIIFDCFHNNIEINDSACNGVTNYILNGIGGDNKFFENYLEQFDDIIQSLLSQKDKEWEEKIEKVNEEAFKYLIEDQDRKDEISAQFYRNYIINN